MIEVIGAIAVVLTLAVVAIPSIRNFQEGGNHGAAIRNASSLNTAVQQYDQAGGLLTARVPVPLDVTSIKNPAQLPEFVVLNLLRGDENGGQVSAWQDIIFDDKGHRVIWVNPIYEEQSVYVGLGGERNDLVERIVASGSSGRFEVINDNGGRMGIVGFRRGDLVIASLPTATPLPPLPTPTPVPASSTSPTPIPTSTPPTPRATPTPLLPTPSPTAITSPTPTLTPTSTPIITLVNRAPTVSVTANQTKSVRGQNVTFTAAGTDPDGDKLQYRFRVPERVFAGRSSDGWSPYSDSRTITSKFTSVGDIKIEAQAKDPGGLASPIASVKVNIKNRAPVVTLRGPAQAMRTTPVSFEAHGQDADQDPLLYSFKPQGGQWSSFGPSNLFTHSFAKLGAQSAEVRTKDSMGSISKPASASILVTPDTYELRANVVVSGSNVTPAQAISLSNISPQGQKIPAKQRHQFSFTPTSGWVIESITGANGFVKTNQTRIAGGTANVNMDRDQVVTIKVKPRPLAYYWNKVMPKGRGNAYPAKSISESGTSFTSALRAGGNNEASIQSKLGEITWKKTNWSYEKLDAGDLREVLKDLGYTGINAKVNHNGNLVANTRQGDAKIIGKNVRENNDSITLTVRGKFQVGRTITTTAKKEGFNNKGNWLRIGGHNVNYYWVSKKVFKTYNHGKSSHIAMIDGETGEFLGKVSVDDRPSIGQIYGSLGKVVGSAVGEEEVNPAISEKLTDKYGISTNGSPVAVDLNGNGMLDLLSDGMWQRNPERTMIASALRKFKLDGEHEKLWEWISNEDGLLVYNPEQKEEMEVTGKELFGNYTFGEKWQHGYEPLSTLDKDGNGRLEGAELAVISVWKDQNMDAKVQKGELLSPKQLRIVAIYTKPEFDQYANAMVEQGVRIQGQKGQDDTLLSTWDWISYGGLDLDTELSENMILNMVSNYEIKGGGIFDKSNLYFGPAIGGYRVFWTIQPNDFTTNNDPFILADDIVTWDGNVFDGDANPIPVRVRATLTDKGKSLKGSTTLGDGTVQSWEGTLNGGLPLSNLNIFTGN